MRTKLPAIEYTKHRIVSWYKGHGHTITITSQYSRVLIIDGERVSVSQSVKKKIVQSNGKKKTAYDFSIIDPRIANDYTWYLLLFPELPGRPFYKLTRENSREKTRISFPAPENERYPLEFIGYLGDLPKPRTA